MRDNKQVIERFYSAFQRLDYKTMNDCYSDDIIFSDPVFLTLKADEVKCMWEMLCKNAKDFSLTYSDIELIDDNYLLPGNVVEILYDEFRLLQNYD